MKMGDGGVAGIAYLAKERSRRNRISFFSPKKECTEQGPRLMHTKEREGFQKYFVSNHPREGM